MAAADLVVVLRVKIAPFGLHGALAEAVIDGEVFDALGDFGICQGG